MTVDFNNFNVSGSSFINSSQPQRELSGSLSGHTVKPIDVHTINENINNKFKSEWARGIIYFLAAKIDFIRDLFLTPLPSVKTEWPKNVKQWQSEDTELLEKINQHCKKVTNNNV